MASLVDFYKQKLAPIGQKLSSFVGNLDQDKSMEGFQIAPGGIRGGVERVSQAFRTNPQQFNVLSPTAQRIGISGLEQDVKPQLKSPLTRTLTNVGTNLLKIGESAGTDVSTGLQRTFRGDVAAGLAQTARGGGKYATLAPPFLPATLATTTAASIDQPTGKSDVLRRAGTGFFEGYTGVKPVDVGVQNKNINVFGVEFDPLQSAASMVGFVKNPLNKQLFKATEAILPGASKKLTTWLGVTAGRGGLENILLNLPEKPENMTDMDKISWMVQNGVAGGVQEIVGRGVLGGLSKTADITGINKVVSKGAELSKKEMTKMFDALAEFKRKANIPVSKPGFGAKLGQTITAPMWKWEMGLVDDGSMQVYKSDIDVPKLEVEPTKQPDLLSEARKYKSAEEFVKSKANLNLDEIGNISRNIQKNDAGYETILSKVLNSENAKNKFRDVLDTRIIVLDKNHPKWIQIGGQETKAAAGSLNGVPTIFLRGGQSTGDIIPTILEEAQHIMQKKIGRNIKFTGSNMDEYLGNRSELAVEKTGGNLVDYMTKDIKQLTTLYNQATKQAPTPVKPLKEVYKEKLSTPTETRTSQGMVSDLQGKTELGKPLVSETPIRTTASQETSLTPIISKKGKLNLERLAVDDTGKQALQDINNELPTSVISNKSVIEKAKTAKGANKPMSDEQMQNLLAQQLKNRQQVVDLSAKFSKAKADGASEEELGKIMLELANQSRTAQQGGTFAGRLLQAQNIVADNSASPMQKVLALLDNAGVSEEKYLKDAVKVNWDQPVDVVKFYRKYVPPQLGEVLTEIRYTNMLSSPLTHITNIASNALQTGIITPVEKSITGLVDAARSLATGKERQYYASAGIDYTKGYLRSLPEAIQKAKNVMNQTEMTIRPDMEYMPTGVGGPLQAYTTPLRALEAMDQFFKTLVQGGITEELGKGPQKLSVTKIASKAEQEANYRLFRQAFDPKGELGQGAVLQLFDKWNSAINGLRRLPGGKWVLPFLQTPTNILKQGFEYSPLGVSTMVGAKNPVEQLSKAIIGTGVFATAYQLATSGLTSWEAPSGEKERELYYAAGMQPYSIKMGDKWVSFSKLGPLSYPIAMAAALADAERKNPDQSKISNIGKSVSGMLGFFGDQSYVRSIGDLVDAIQGGVSVGANAISGQAANIAGQLIPYKSFLTWLGRITDPVYRKASTFGERMVKDLPILGAKLEPYTDIYGKPSKRDLPLVNAISPYKVTVEKKNEVPFYNQYEQTKIQNAIEKRAGEKLSKQGGSIKTGGVYQYIEDGSVKRIDIGKVTSLPSSTRYEQTIKDQEKWKLADDILKLSPQDQATAFKELGISQQDAQYYSVATNDTVAKYAYVQDQMQGVKNYEEFLQRAIPLMREVNGKAILSSSVIDELYNNNIISSAQKKQLKSIDFSGAKPKLKSSGATKVKYVKAVLPASVRSSLPKVKRIRSKRYKLVVPKAK